MAMALKKTAGILTITAAAGFIVLQGVNAFAGIAQPITKDMARAKTVAFEQAVNDLSDPMTLISFMHDHISDDAEITITVSNAATGETADKTPPLEISKEDYINSFVHARPLIDYYKADVKMVDFRYDPKTNKAVTVEIMSERGVSERAFNSSTKCITEHELRDDVLTSTKALCHTDISFEENI